MHNATWEPSAVKPLPAEFQSSSYRHPVQLKEEQWKLPPVLWIQECANIDYNASMSEDSDANALEGSVAAAKGEINSALCRMAHGIIPRVGFDFSANPEGGEDATNVVLSPPTRSSRCVYKRVACKNASKIQSPLSRHSVATQSPL